MSQTGFTPLLIYASSTTGNTPLASKLTNNTIGSELAINIFDGKLFYKDSAGVVQVLATKASASNTFSGGTTGFTPNTATTGAVTLAGTLIVGNGGTGVATLSGLAYGNGTGAFTAATAAQVVAVISTTPVATATNATTSNAIANTGGWAVTPSGTKLYFSYNGVNKASLDSSGNFIALANVTAYGTV